MHLFDCPGKSTFRITSDTASDSQTFAPLGAGREGEAVGGPGREVSEQGGEAAAAAPGGGNPPASWQLWRYGCFHQEFDPNR